MVNSSQTNKPIIFIMYMVVYKGGYLSKKENDYYDNIDDKKEHTIECRIKKHDTFNGIKQTVIERPKVLS
jgi:hypothetical protein